MSVSLSFRLHSYLTENQPSPEAVGLQLDAFTKNALILISKIIYVSLSALEQYFPQPLKL